MLTQTERSLKESNIATNEVHCIICIESCVTPVMLTCGHQFCWECLARAVLNGIKTCPLCRSEQSLNPVDLNISAILGAVDVQKYFPSNVDPTEIRKRVRDEPVWGNVKRAKLLSCGTQEKLKCQSGTNHDAVNLTSWIMERSMPVEKYCSNTGNCCSKPKQIYVASPFNVKDELHFEIADPGNLKVHSAIVMNFNPVDCLQPRLNLGEKKADLTFSREDTRLPKSLPFKGGSRYAKYSGKKEESVDDWINDVVKGLDLNFTSSTYLGAIEV